MKLVPISMYLHYPIVMFEYSIIMCTCANFQVMLFDNEKININNMCDLNHCCFTNYLNTKKYIFHNIILW